MNDRRILVIALATGALSTPLAGLAQPQRSQVARIGLLESDFAASAPNLREALMAGLREFGLVEGRNLVIETRWAEGRYERLPGLAAELVQAKVDVIVAGGGAAIQAARQATTRIPIVMVRIGDPVASGFVESLSRPGGNVTGLSNMIGELAGKYLELLRAAVPKLSRVAVLVNPSQPTHLSYLKRIEAAEKTNTVTILPVLASSAGEIEAAFGAIKQQRAEALIVEADPFFASQSPRIVELAAQQRLPTLFWSRRIVESGGLMSYGQSNAEHYYRAATYIDKLLKGAKASELPVEQATKVELVINLKTAKAIGLTIPQQLLLQADVLIE